MGEGVQWKMNQQRIKLIIWIGIISVYIVIPLLIGFKDLYTLLIFVFLSVLTLAWFIRNVINLFLGGEMHNHPAWNDKYSIIAGNLLCFFTITLISIFMCLDL